MNKIPGCDTLTEDGVYGEKTSSAYNFLIHELLHGSFPILTYIDPLQSAYTGIYAKPQITKQGQIFPQIFAEGTKWPIFRVDFHPIGGGNPVPHINAGAINGASAGQQSAAEAFDHKEIPKEVYDLLKSFDGTAKIIKIGGKILLVAGVVAFVGGVPGGLALGVLGSIGGSALGEWIVDISNIRE